MVSTTLTVLENADVVSTENRVINPMELVSAVANRIFNVLFVKVGSYMYVSAVCIKFNSLYHA